ncbi:uncharacterized protein LOC133183624 [Saccostrea echinata]|uniref:uncharacterized protein LOC133183624 n=1 Tax=Saccostrea echinata TaxID=191078 RepID=UPI002A815115|nr:uncharacterized protein LOC133183624 [Saccostrea echinata]
MELDKERWKIGMNFTMYFLAFFLATFVHLKDTSLGQVVGNGMDLDVNKFFPHLLENSMHAVNPLAASSGGLGKECIGTGSSFYGNIPMGNPMQTGFIANEQCPCQFHINSLGCYVCSCNSDSPRTNLMIPTPNAPGLNMQFQYPNGQEYVTKRHTENMSSEKVKATLLPTTKIQSNTNLLTTSKREHGDVIQSTTSLLKKINSTTKIIDRDGTKSDVRSTVIAPTMELGNISRSNSDKAANVSSFPEKYMAIFVGLGIVLCLFFILVVIFVLKWRSTTKELRRQQSELYFVEKINRQSSVVSELTLELEREKRTSLYSVVEYDYESTSPKLDFLLTPTAPPLTPGQKQQTAFRYPTDDSKHDYLELI